jgi:hypothetical protein
MGGAISETLSALATVSTAKAAKAERRKNEGTVIIIQTALVSKKAIASTFPCHFQRRLSIPAEWRSDTSSR